MGPYSISCEIVPRPASSGEPVNYVVTKVSTELADNGNHRHIKGVCVADATHYHRAQVVASIRAGNTWMTRSTTGSTATIREITFCPGSGCFATPYITTRQDSSKDDNLENLPPCNG